MSLNNGKLHRQRKYTWWLMRRTWFVSIYWAWGTTAQDVHRTHAHCAHERNHNEPINGTKDEQNKPFLNKGINNKWKMRELCSAVSNGNRKIKRATNKRKLNWIFKLLASGQLHDIWLELGTYRFKMHLVRNTIDFAWIDHNEIAFWLFIAIVHPINMAFFLYFNHNGACISFIRDLSILHLVNTWPYHRKPILLMMWFDPIRGWFAQLSLFVRL